VTTSKVQQHSAELNRLAVEAESLSKRLSAFLTLHEAACLNGTSTELGQRREEVHTLLDAILDNTEAVHRESAALRRVLES
jgi:hypothetical protein